MSIKIMQEVWQSAPVSGGTLLVLLAIADSADETSRTCFPGIENLAHKARLSERQVKRVIAELTDLAIIHVDRNASPFKTNLYRISDPHLWCGSDNMSPTPMGRPCHPRWDAHVTSDGTPMSPKPSVTSEEPSDRAREELFLFPEETQPKRQDQTSDQFETFWKVYPRKEGKKKARENFARAVKAGADPQDIVAGAKRYAAAVDGTEARFIKWAQGWLTEERWTDHPEPDMSPPPSGPGHRLRENWAGVER